MTKKYQPQYQKLVARLREARLQARLTQAGAAKKLRKPQSYISKIERGERRIDVLEVADIARIYKKPIRFFIT